jgi:hypothetical protein
MQIKRSNKNIYYNSYPLEPIICKWIHYKTYINIISLFCLQPFCNQHLPLPLLCCYLLENLIPLPYCRKNIPFYELFLSSHERFSTSLVSPLYQGGFFQALWSFVANVQMVAWGSFACAEGLIWPCSPTIRPTNWFTFTLAQYLQFLLMQFTTLT